MSDVHFEESFSESLYLDSDSSLVSSDVSGLLESKWREKWRKVLLSPPPPRWFYIGRWFRFGIGLFLFLTLLLSSVGCSSSAAAVPWQNADRVVPTEVLQQVVSNDTELDPVAATKDVLAWVVDGRANKVVVFDFNNSGLCGAAGCLYTAYLFNKNKPPAQVFSNYLHTDLPPGRSLFSLGELDTESGLPCLQVTQSEDTLLRQSTYCYNGGFYQLSRSVLLDTTNANNHKKRPLVQPTKVR